MKNLIILHVLSILLISCSRNDHTITQGGNVSADVIITDGIKLNGTDTGGGGDHVVQDVYRVVQNVIYELAQYETADRDAENFYVQFSTLWPNLKVISASYLELNGKEVTAINIPNENLLYISRSHWIQIPSEKDKFAFIIHELLGLAKIVDPESYSLSNRWAKILYPNIPDVCGRSTPLVKTLEFDLAKSCESITLEDLASITKLEIINYTPKARLERPTGQYSTNHSLLEDKLNFILMSHDRPSRLWSLRHNDLKGMDHLKSLLLKSANLTSIDSDALVGLASLEILDLSSNFLPHLPSKLFDGLVNLKELDISNNKFKGFVYPLSASMGRLKILNISNNPEVELISAEFFKGLFSLEKLNMENLINFRHLWPGTFSDLTSLIYLNLNGTNAYLEDDSLIGLIGLKTLELESWNAESDSWTPTSLRDFSVEYEDFKVLPQKLFRPLPNLVDLSLRFSNVGHLNLDMFSHNPNLEMVCSPDSRIDSYGCINLINQN